jgi:hypothetical protein
MGLAYGAEAGRTDRLVAAMCRRYCGHSLPIMRNEESRAVAHALLEQYAHSRLPAAFVA